MVWCNRKRKICFYCKFRSSFKAQLSAFLAGTVAGIITIEACVFFFMLLYFNSENAAYDDLPPEQYPTATSHDGLTGENANPKPLPKPINMGHLTFLPANRASITVDFVKAAEYSSQNMNLILDEYAEFKGKACLKAPELSLGDCDEQTYYGLELGFFCLIARLEETRNWIPDDFLQTDWLPHYKDDFLPVSCDIVAQNKSYIRNDKLHEFYYRKQLRNIWPASGFPKKLFPLGKAPGNCYPPVAIKVDDPFVLNYQHDQISVICAIWSYNSRTLAADSVSINVTLLRREEALKQPRKAKHSAGLSYHTLRKSKWLESTSTTKVTLPSTQGTPKDTTSIKPIELLSVHFTKSMLPTNSTSTTARFTSIFIKSSASITALPLSSTGTTTYMDFTKPPATSHKRSQVTGASEINSVKQTIRTLSLTKKASKPTGLILNVTLPSLAITTRERKYHGETNSGSTTEGNFKDILTTTEDKPEKSKLSEKNQQAFSVELQNHSSTVKTSSISIPTTSAVSIKNESNSFSSPIRALNFTPSLETSSVSLETTLALETPSIRSGNASRTLKSTSSVLETRSSTLETTSRTMESTSSTLKTTPSTLKTTSSTLETTFSTLKTTPSTLKTTSSTLETISRTLKTTPSTFKTTPNTFETTSSTLKTTPSTLKITSSTLETISSTLKTTPSTLETTSSTLKTTPSMLKTTLAFETSSTPLETSSSTVSASKEIPSTVPNFDHPAGGGENSHYSDDE